MSVLVTEDQISSYQRDGVILFKNMLDSRWLEILAEGIEENLKAPSNRTFTLEDTTGDNARFFFDQHFLGEINAYDRLMLDSPMAQAAARFMGSTQAILFYISVFIRSAGARARTPWHQDQASWSAVGDQACSM